ncbi:MAG: rRNA pseudouridine synthase [Deltaproteobacteria bacterium]|nr:rRNA pseudouridine synthase [Deltaproteobacteria bacterium]
MTTIRLNKFLAQVTPLSRRAADRAIAVGEIAVDGRVVTALGARIDPRRDRVAWKGRSLRRGSSAPIYLAFYKPRNTLVTKSDPRGRPTIWDRLARYRDRCDAVGRLDFASEGLLLITDDGAWIARLTHPRYAVPKAYHVKVRGAPSPAAIERMAGGVTLAGERLQPLAVRALSRTGANTWLEICLSEGKYREIRRLCETMGHPVAKLRRVAVGPIRLGRLKVGEVRRLHPREIAALRREIS